MLELRVPTEDELTALLEHADASIYERTGFMPFRIDWTGNPIESMKHFWGARASWTAEAWTLSMVPFIDGEPLGNQELRTTNFPIIRRVSTGSYVLAHAQGRGIGTEMRAAALHLAFAGLGAVEAHSEAHVDNAASNKVSQRLGYEITHRQSSSFGERQADVYNLMLRREVWEQHRRDDIEILGLEGCLGMFGLESPIG